MKKDTNHAQAFGQCKRCQDDKRLNRFGLCEQCQENVDYEYMQLHQVNTMED